MSAKAKFRGKDRIALYLAMLQSMLAPRGFTLDATMRSTWTRLARDRRSEAWLAAQPDTGKGAGSLFTPTVAVLRVDVEWLLNGIREGASTRSEFARVPVESLWLEGSAVARESLSKLAASDGPRRYLFGPESREEFAACLESMRVDFEKFALPWMARGESLEGWLQLALSQPYMKGLCQLPIAAAQWMLGDQAAAIEACHVGRSGPHAVCGVMSPEDTSGMTYERYADWFRRHEFDSFREAMDEAMATRAARRSAGVTDV